MRWKKVALALALILVGLAVFQPKLLPFLSSESVQAFAENFNPGLQSTNAETELKNLDACKSVAEMNVPTNALISMAFGKVDERFERSLDLIALKVARCHIVHTDGIGYPFYTDAYWYFHPFVRAYARQVEELRQQCGEELHSSCSLHRIVKHENLLEDDAIKAEVSKICASLLARSIDNYGPTCQLLEKY